MLKREQLMLRGRGVISLGHSAAGVAAMPELGFVLRQRLNARRLDRQLTDRRGILAVIEFWRAGGAAYNDAGG